LTDGPGGCGEVASSGCVIGSEQHSGKVTCILRRKGEGLGQTRRCRCISDLFLVYRLKIAPAKNHALPYTDAQKRSGPADRRAVLDNVGEWVMENNGVLTGINHTS